MVSITMKSLLLLSLVFFFSTTGAPLDTFSWPEPSGGRTELSATSLGSKIFFAGGNGPSAAIDIYDTTTKIWTYKTLTGPGRSPSVTSTKNKAFFAGGQPNSDYTKISSTVDIFDGTTWNTATIPVPRCLMASATYGTKVYFFGGVDTTTTRSNRVDIFDSSSGLWLTPLNMSSVRAYHSAVTVGNKIIIAGGASAGDAVNTIEILDADTDTWIPTSATLSVARNYAAVTSVGGKAIFVGGSDVNTYDAVDIYDSVKDVWSSTTISKKLFFMSAATDGTLAYFAGGKDFSNVISNTVYIYDPTGDGSWLPTDTLSSPRFSGAGAGIPGSVFFGGGMSSNGVTRTVDIFGAIPQIPTPTPIETPTPTEIPTPTPTPTAPTTCVGNCTNIFNVQVTSWNPKATPFKTRCEVWASYRTCLIACTNSEVDVGNSEKQCSATEYVSELCDCGNGQPGITGVRLTEILADFSEVFKTALEDINAIDSVDEPTYNENVAAVLFRYEDTVAIEEILEDIVNFLAGFLNQKTSTFQLSSKKRAVTELQERELSITLNPEDTSSGSTALSFSFVIFLVVALFQCL